MVFKVRPKETGGEWSEEAKWIGETLVYGRSNDQSFYTWEDFVTNAEWDNSGMTIAKAKKGAKELAQEGCAKVYPEGATITDEGARRNLEYSGVYFF